MPISREPTTQELEELRQQGVDVDKIPSGTKLDFDDTPQTSKTQAVTSTLKSHAGGILGGGAGALGAGAALSWLAGPEVGLPVSLIAGALGAAGGGYGGQKLQEKLQSDETNQKQAQEQALVEREHPNIALGTDIVAGALASGGAPKPSNIPKAIRGLLGRTALSDADKLAFSQLGREAVTPAGNEILARNLENSEALKNVAIQSVVNPAIQTGLSYATTGQLPSAKELLAQAAGGALFSGSNPLSRLGHPSAEKADIQPNGEPNQRWGEIRNQPDILTPNPEISSPFKQKIEGGKYSIDDSAVRSAWKEANPKPSVEGMSDTEGYKILSDWRRSMKLPTEDIRNALHQQWVSKQKESGVVQPKTEPAQEPTVKNAPEVEKPVIPTDQKLEDFKKAQQEAALQNANEVQAVQPQASQEQPKPASENTLRITQPGMLQSDITRPESFDRERYAPIEHPEGDLSGKEGDFAQYGWMSKGHEIRLRGNISRETLAGLQRWLDQNNEVIKKDPQSAKSLNFDNKIIQEEIDRRISSIQESSIPINQGKVEAQPSPEQLTKLKEAAPKAKDMLEIIGNDPSSPYQQLAKDLKLDSKSASVPLIQGLNYRGTSFYHGGEDFIGIHDRHIATDMALIHEIAHAATMHKLPDEWLGLKGYKLKGMMDEYLKSGSNESVKELVRSYYETAKNLGPDTWSKLFGETREGKPFGKGLAGLPHDVEAAKIPYGMGDLNEFIAESLSNKKFQEKLNNMPSGLNDGKSMWSRLVDAIRKILGVDIKNGSMLERVLKPIDELTQQERPKENATTTGKEQTNNSPEHLRISQREHLSEYSKEEGKEKGEQTSSRNRFQSGKEVEINPNIGGKAAQLFRSTLDKIRQIPHPVAKELANAGQRMLDEKQNLIGKWLHPVLEMKSKVSTLGERHLEAAQRYEMENQKPAPETMFRTQGEREAWKLEKKLLEENYQYRLENKEPVIEDGQARLPKQDQFYHPTTPSPKFIEDVKSNKNMESNQKIFMDYQDKLGVEDSRAKDNWDRIVSSIQGSIKTGTGIKGQEHFGAARLPQGVPLPPELTRPGYFKNLESYVHRMANDNTFYKHIESNDKIMSALGETKTPWGIPLGKDTNGTIANVPAVRSFLNEIHGESGGAGYHNEKVISSFFTGAILGPGTEIHKVGASQIGAINSTDNPYQTAKYLTSAVTGFKEGLKHAIENGVLRMTATRLSDAVDSNLMFADRLRAVSQAIRKVSTLNELTDKLNIGLMQGGFEGIMPMKVARANDGDVTNQQLLKRLDPDYVIGKTYDKDGISKLASKMINTIQGTGDARTMPPWMMGDSEISGFFKLSHWSVSQTNRFFTQTFEPATRGDFNPLIKGVFGSLIGGYMIKELREALQGKKNQIPSLSEIASSSRGLSGNTGPLVYNALAAATYSGFGGMLSMFAKMPVDMIYKNKPQGMIFPLDEFVGDVAQTVSQATTAIANDPNLNMLTLAQAVTGHLLSSNFQLGRVVYNQALNYGVITGLAADKKNLSDKLADLRRFDIVEGLPYSDLDQGSNPYMNLEQKKFKLEQNPQEAMKMVPELINNIIHAYSNSPDVMMTKLKALKENTYATFPSMESTPISFMKYLSFLGKTEGPEQAQSALVDYMRHRVMNEAKASVIP